jgi:ABC-type dipeptide/oligopeptide/nickel transport system permease subunit
VGNRLVALNIEKAFQLHRGDPYVANDIANHKILCHSTYCLYPGAEVYFFIGQASKGEDIARGVMMGFIIIFIAVIIATAVALFERTFQNDVDMKSENDLTV